MTISATNSNVARTISSTKTNSSYMSNMSPGPPQQQILCCQTQPIRCMTEMMPDSVEQQLTPRICKWTQHKQNNSTHTKIKNTRVGYLGFLPTKNKTMASLRVATLTVQRKYIGSLPYLCTKDETMTPHYVTTLSVQRELPYKNKTMAPLHVAALTVQRELPNTSVPRIKPWLHFMWPH